MQLNHHGHAHLCQDNLFANPTMGQRTVTAGKVGQSLLEYQLCLHVDLNSSERM